MTVYAKKLAAYIDSTSLYTQAASDALPKYISYKRDLSAENARKKARAVAQALDAARDSMTSAKSTADSAEARQYVSLLYAQATVKATSPETFNDTVLKQNHIVKQKYYSLCQQNQQKQSVSNWPHLANLKQKRLPRIHSIPQSG